MADRYDFDSLSENDTVAEQSVHVLLVEPDEAFSDLLHEHLVGHIPGMTATQCCTATSARAYLSGSSFDAVLVADELPDGTGLELLHLRSVLGLTSPFFLRTCENGEVSEDALAAGATACFDVTSEQDSLTSLSTEMIRAMGLADHSNGSITNDTPRVSPDAAIAMLEELRAEAAGMAHAVSNPLTVITGNAQFLLEVARTEEVDPVMMGPIEDIDRASQQLAEALERLAALRERIAETLGTQDRIKKA